MRSLKTAGPNLSRDFISAAHTTAVAAVRRMPEQALLRADNCRAERLKDNLKEQHSFDGYPEQVTASLQDEHAVPGRC